MKPTKQGGRGGKLNPVQDAIIARVRAQPDITMSELAAWREVHHGVTADLSNLLKRQLRHGLSYRKTLPASQKERADAKKARRAVRRAVVSNDVQLILG